MLRKKITDYPVLLVEFDRQLPHFPDGRINYTSSSVAPVVLCFLKFQDEILLLQRSNKVLTYQNLWNTVGGYLDEPKKNLEQKAREEVTEETGIGPDLIEKIIFAQLFDFYDAKINRRWLMFPCLFVLKQKPAIKLDFEHLAWRWVKKEELNLYPTTPKLADILAGLLQKESSISN